TFSKIFCFITLASGLKDNILLMQAASHHPDSAPLVLSPAIKLFLASSCDILESDVDTYWKALRNIIWHGDGGTSSVDIMKAANMDNIWLPAPCILFLPHHTCQTCDCPAHHNFLFLTIMMHAKCHTNYHHGFSVKAGVQTFYPGIPDILQVGGHQFVETKDIHLWHTMTLISWY
ncbi:hypothetical protein BDR05DRAFT_845112, partial [Suillus weaverae]